MDTRDISYEPMDIDSSTNSVSVMELTCQQENDTERSNTPVENVQAVTFDDAHSHVSKNIERLKGLKVNRYYKDKTREQSKWHKVCIKFILYTSLIIIQLSIVGYILNIKCYDELDLKLLDNTFKSRVYDQSIAIESFMKALKDYDKSKLLVLYGGTGVGKTFTVSLLLNSILNNSNTYHYMMPSIAQTFSSEFMLGLILCKTSTIVIDDLSINDTEVIGIVKELLLKSRNLKKKINIILIYNCDNTISKSENSCNNLVPALKSQLHVFEEEELQKTYIKFDPLNEESLQKCIQYEVGVKLSKSKLIKMMKNFNVHQDGCKGVHQKIKYLNMV